MRVIQEGVVEVARPDSEWEVFKAEPRMDTNENECKRIRPPDESVNVTVFLFFDVLWF